MRTTIVLSAVARSESVFFIPHFASIEVSPANTADNIAANTAAINVLNGDDKTVGSVDYKVAQEVAKLISDNDADIDTLEEIAAWIVNDTTGAAKMNKDILANTTAIDTINTTTIPNALAEAKKHTDDSITALKLVETYEAKGAAAAALVEAKSYIDDAIDALNVGVTEAVSGHDALTVSTDDNGKVTIGFAANVVLNGGSANS